MSKRKVQQPPPHPSPKAGSNPLGLHHLDRFSARDLEAWRALSADLDELHAALYYQIQPQRMRRKDELVRALNSVQSGGLVFDGWFRAVDYRYSDMPLSVAGSLKSVGGRFNIGVDVDHSMTPAYPALYIGDSLQTAHQERFQVSSDGIDGLKPEDLALAKSVSYVRVRGSVERVIDVSRNTSLTAICKVLAKIRMPDSVTPIMRRLKMRQSDVFMIRTPAQLAAALQDQNWRSWPVQFGIPSPSQQFAELARSAGFEGIVYRSTKNKSGRCLALFADVLGSYRTFVELVDGSPVGVETRLDMDSIERLR